MATITTNIPTIVFPHELNTLHIESSSKTTVKITVGGVSIFEAALNPDNGVIEVDDIAALLREHCEEGACTLAIYLDSALTAAATATLLPCGVIMSETAEGFLATSFMTSMRGDKHVSLKSIEYLSYFSQEEEEDAAVSAVWWDDQEKEILTSTATTEIVSESGDIITIDVSPCNLTAPRDLATLISYEVVVGERKQRFVMIPPSFGVVNKSVRFRNTFGCPDTFHFFGDDEKTLKPTRLSAVVKGKFKNFSIQGIPSRKISTGLIPEGQMSLLEDLCTTISPIQLLKENIEVVITECELKETSSPYQMSECSVTWREATMARHWEPLRKVRTFDETFDQTFQ